MENTHREKIMKMTGGDETFFDVVHEAITEYGITAKAYAAAFCYLNAESADSDRRLSYSTGGKGWRRGKDAVTDAHVVHCLCVTCDLIREYIRLSWEECVFSAWLPQRELQKAEKSLDLMESMEQMKTILGLAAEAMKTKDADAKIDWDSFGDPEEDGEAD